MNCYRYVTPALKGRWRCSPEDALGAALVAGQAFRHGCSILLFDFARIQAQPAHRCLKECQLRSDLPAPEPEYLFCSPADLPRRPLRRRSGLGCQSTLLRRRADNNDRD
jgi:predicted exporter